MLYKLFLFLFSKRWKRLLFLPLIITYPMYLYSRWHISFLYGAKGEALREIVPNTLPGKFHLLVGLGDIEPILMIWAILLVGFVISEIGRPNVWD